MADKMPDLNKIYCGVVYDPFMGACTTAPMALRAGRDFIGTELSQKYIDLADKRLAQKMSQGRLL